ncbi:cation transporter [Leptospira ognonensis]|uniref:Cation transporter n=1 Tax=Leptospira ognonensis TaxID=2484945 RepID=A0A4V3JRA0_9LEPT|nr:cation diffusion facilitator family transporter [Leptospira ognonensis]TGL59205.1 cation transporter [Leptospira ognonensis]
MTHAHNHQKESEKILNRSFIAGICLNLVYVIIETIYGFTENSTSLLSDAVHNIGDISGLLLAFLAFKLVKVKSSSKFTYGFKKGSILASFVNSILLAFAIGAIAWEGIQKIAEPKQISGLVVIYVASVGVGINFVSAILFKKEKDHDLNVKAAYLHLLIDALVSLGVVLSGILIYYFDLYIMDGITAIVVAMVVLYSSVSLFKDSLIAILDGIPESVNLAEIKNIILNVTGVKGVHHVHIWGLSTSEIALTSHILISDLTQIPRIKNSIKQQLKECYIQHCTLEFEIDSEVCAEATKVGIIPHPNQ